MCHILMQLNHAFKQLWQAREQKKEEIKTKKKLDSEFLPWEWLG